MLTVFGVFLVLSFWPSFTQRTNAPEPVAEQSVLDAKIENKTISDSAAQALGKIAVRERAQRYGYSRAEFGPTWPKVDGCDMRNRILARDLENTVLEDNGCTVLKGILVNDPYTGDAIEFVRGASTSSKVQIDHVVALSDAWQKGAQDLTAEQRLDFANDALNLLAVDGPANMAKGDKDAGDWLPPNKSYRCRYVARQIVVKIKYFLWVTKSELNAMRRVLFTCPNQQLPIVGGLGG